MDTMDVKHITCFGPCMVDEWNLQPWKEEILRRWNEINLYTITRGINRFKGLFVALEEINAKYTEIDDLQSLADWTKNAKELSNGALKEYLKINDSVILKKALNWSIAVNEEINRIPEDKKVPFPLVKEALNAASERADVAIVSSANLDAVLQEWQKHGLLENVNVVLSQNDGSKAYCISQLLKKGYNNANVLMCGDAPGDLQAAKENNVFYFPILVRKEKESWQEFISTALNKLTTSTYGGEYQKEKVDEFLNNLSSK